MNRLTDVCVITSSATAYMASCDSESITVTTYTSNSCDGTGNTTTYNAEDYAFFWDARVYCSSDSGYGDCYDSGIKLNAPIIIISCLIIGVSSFVWV